MSSTNIIVEDSPPPCTNEDEEGLGGGDEAPEDNHYSSSNNGCIPKHISLLQEFSGSCGDFGTLIPLLVALARQRAIYLAPTLLGTGLVHIVTGLYWDLPMPLQPMKSIASLAIAQELTRMQVTTAGVGMGICFLLLQFGNTIEVLHKWIPTSVIGGLQLGVGWKLAIRGIHMMQELPWWAGDTLDCIATSVVCSLLCLYWLRPQRNEQHQPQESTMNEERQQQPPSSCWERFVAKPPVGLYLFGVGVILAAIQLATSSEDTNTTPNNTKEPLIVNALKDVTWNDWKIGFLQGTLPQLPLTTLNSCLSVCLLAHTLFPEKPVSRRSVCRSIGLMNLLLCPLGCMPHCHGAGGLAGQYRLGARYGGSMVALGLFKIGLSLVAYQGSLLKLLDALPVSILGVLLVLAGHELATTGIQSVLVVSSSSSDDETSTAVMMTNTNISISLITGLVIVGTGQTHVGALCGWITYMIHGNGYQNLPCFFLFADSPTTKDNDDDDDDDRGRYAHVEQASNDESPNGPEPSALLLS
jgi:hypothetical protein